ncbi:MAG: hypothetical protein ACLQM8_12710 [Limisphaerales bacterium]
MNRLGTGTGDGNAAGGKLPRLQVLAVYEDFATGLRARQTLDQTVLRLGAAVGVQLNLWRFDILCEPALREQVAKEAAAADIVVISMHGQGELPASVNLWLEEWSGRKGGKPCALVVSLDAAARDTARAAQTVEALGAVARLAGVDVFLHLGAGAGGVGGRR